MLERLCRTWGDGFCQLAEKRRGLFPAETGIGDGDAVGQRYALLPSLLAGIQVAFEHESHDRVTAVAELAEDVARDHTLAAMIFTGVVVRTVDHDGTDDTLTCDNSFRASYVLSFIIGFARRRHAGRYAGRDSRLS